MRDARTHRAAGHPPERPDGTERVVQDRPTAALRPERGDREPARPADNIPASYIALRNLLCQSLSIDPADVPFAGELIQVSRTLGLGGSGRARDAHVRPVAAGTRRALLNGATWVDQTNLRSRLVYFRCATQGRSTVSSTATRWSTRSRSPPGATGAGSPRARTTIRLRLLRHPRAVPARAAGAHKAGPDQRPATSATRRTTATASTTAADTCSAGRTPASRRTGAKRTHSRRTSQASGRASPNADEAQKEAAAPDPPLAKLSWFATSPTLDWQSPARQFATLNEERERSADVRRARPTRDELDGLTNSAGQSSD